MATYTKRANGRWQAKVRKAGAPPLSNIFHTKADARAWAKKIEDEIASGKFVAPAELERTLGDLIARYIDDDLPTLQARRNELSERDRGKRVAMLGWWRDRLGSTPLARLSPGPIREALAELRRGDSLSGRPASEATSNRYRAILSAALSYGMQLDPPWLDAHPMKGGRVAVRGEPARDVRAAVYSAEEVNAVREAIAATGCRRLLAAFAFTLATGARPCELFETRGAKTTPLRWADLDLDTGEGTIGRSKAGERGKSFLVAGEALIVLREWAEHCGRRGKVRRLDGGPELVFADPEMGAADFPRERWNAARKAAGVDRDWYDLRHTAASRLLSRGGVALEEVSAILGHSSPAVTRRYATFLPEYQARRRELAEAMAEGL